MPRNHRIEVFTAIVEDEGTFDKNRLIIRMSDKRLMQLISILIDSLNYGRSQLKSYLQYSFFLKRRIMIYRIDLNIRSIKRYYDDLNKLKQKYGTLAGLWAKNKKLKRLSQKNTLMDGYDRHEKLIPKILERFLNRHKFLFSDIKETFKLTDNKTASILRCLINKKLMNRIERGVYSLNKSDKYENT